MTNKKQIKVLLALLAEARNEAIIECIVAIRLMGPDRLDGLVNREKAVAELKGLLSEVEE